MYIHTSCSCLLTARDSPYKENSHGAHMYIQTDMYVCMSIQPISDYASFNVVCIHTMYVCTHMYFKFSFICMYKAHTLIRPAVCLRVCATFEISRHMSFPILYCVKIHKPSAKCVQFRWHSKLITI